MSSVMLERFLSFYTADRLMPGGVRSPMPHLIGPPGSGKSTLAEIMARVLQVDLHIMNVARISPLELEGVQMPDKDNTRLEMLTATFWNNLNDGDIVLMDEFLRTKQPEIYNGLLDIFTSRTVGGHSLPQVFIMAASNDARTPDPAVKDRLLNIYMPDIRNDSSERKAVEERIINLTGLNPEMVGSGTLTNVMRVLLDPLYAQAFDMDQSGTRATYNIVEQEGMSARNVIGRMQLRDMSNQYVAAVILDNNTISARREEFQYLLVNEKYAKFKPVELEETLKKVRACTPEGEIQEANKELNIQLLTMYLNKKKGKENHDDNDLFTPAA